MILIELVELICQSAGTCTPTVSQEYRISKIISELAQFLKHLRETTQSFRFNQNRIQRNNSMSIIYLVCRLVMFKGNYRGSARSDLTKKDHLDGGSSSSNEYNPKMFASTFNNQSSLASECGDSQSESFASAFENTYQLDHETEDWARELEFALLDYPLKHYYSDVHELVAHTLKACARLPFS